MCNYRVEREGRQIPSPKSARGCAEKSMSMDEAIRRNEGLVHAYIRRHGGGDLSYQEALQAGRIGLWRALRRFDPGRGFAFSTYSWIAIARSIYRASIEDRPRHPSGRVGASEGAYTLDLEAGMDQLLINQALNELVNRLPARQKRIVVARYGLGGTPIQQLAKLGAELQVTSERVRQLEQEAVAWLRHPARSVALRVLLEANSARDYRQALHLNAEVQRKRRGRS